MELLAFLCRLDEAKIHYRLGHHQPDSITVEVAIPGERWEIAFYQSGRVDVEKFCSDGRTADHTVLEGLFREGAVSPSDGDPTAKLGVQEAVFDLPPDEKLQLVQDLWEDLAAHPDDVPVPPWQIAEAKRRKAEFEQDPSSGVTWEEMKRRIRERHGF